MNKYGIGILGAVLLAVCGEQFGTDKNIMLLLVIGFAVLILSDKKKG